MRMKSMILLLLVLALALPLCAATEGADEITGYSRAGGHRYVLFGAYPTEEDGTVKPILWRVLRAENGEAWLLSEYILFAAPVHGDHEHYAGWESSDLYKYLNEVFINDAFSAGEQSALLCRTEDSALVTLITSNDMKDASIGFSSNKDRLCEGTPYASVAVDVWSMFLSIVQVVIAPIALGLLLNHFFGKYTHRVTKVLPLISVLAICLIVMAVVSHNAERILSTGAEIMAVVALHNLLGYACGFGLGKLLKLDMAQTKALTIEIGMQNSGLAASLARTAFPSLAMATVPGAIFSVWHNISGAILANWFRKKKPGETV